MARDTISIGLVGVGKIALDQHVPAIWQSSDFRIAASSSPRSRVDGVLHFDDVDGMIAGVDGLSAITICTPPRERYAIASKAIAAGLHVMLEKPPGATACEVSALAEAAARRNVTLFVTWHSRESAAVDFARAWLLERRVRTVRIDWREDVRVWHPGQDWIFSAGGFGVFDPGINALSIATAILPGALRVQHAILSVPTNRAAPVAASIAMLHDDEGLVKAELDFLHPGPPCWDIIVETDDGTLKLQKGGRELSIDGTPVVECPDAEYPRLYQAFAELIDKGLSDVDLRPLQLVADAFLVGQATQVPEFNF